MFAVRLADPKSITIAVNDSKKAKELLGASLRPIEETIRDCVESAIELGLITPKLASL